MQTPIGARLDDKDGAGGILGRSVTTCQRGVCDLPRAHTNIRVGLSGMRSTFTHQSAMAHGSLLALLPSRNDGRLPCRYYDGARVQTFR